MIFVIWGESKDFEKKNEKSKTIHHHRLQLLHIVIAAKCAKLLIGRRPITGVSVSNFKY
jgi:hypothetical protein